MARIGVLNAEHAAEFTLDGWLTVPDWKSRVTVWVGAGDHWHDISRSVTVRQQLIDALPIVETKMRIASGDVVVTAYGAHANPDVCVLETLNASPEPVVIAIVADSSLVATADSSDKIMRGSVVLPRAPRQVLHTEDLDELWSMVQAAHVALDFPFDNADFEHAAQVDRGVTAYLYPLAHQARMRVGYALSSGVLPDNSLDTLPDASAVATSWRAQLDRGMRVELPDPKLQSLVVTERAQLLLQHQEGIANSESMIALEDWGFDQEAAVAFDRLGFRQRRKARTRPMDTNPWSYVSRALDAVTRTGDLPDGPAPFLNRLQSMLVCPRPDGSIDIMTYLPPEWRGQAVTVQHAPTRYGTLSFALRWHGPRVALLWEIDRPGVTLRAPGINPTWSTSDARGDALLTPV
jgi:hypothetical protein